MHMNVISCQIPANGSSYLSSREHGAEKRINVGTIPYIAMIVENSFFCENQCTLYGTYGRGKNN